MVQFLKFLLNVSVYYYQEKLWHISVQWNLKIVVTPDSKRLIN